MVGALLDLLAAQTEDPEITLTGEAKNNSVDSVVGALILTGKLSSISRVFTMKDLF